MADSTAFDPSRPGFAGMIDESCVLLPVSSLEDFPKSGRDEDARSMLAAWSVLWHPALIVACGGPPNWFRADSLPESTGNRLIAIDPKTREESFSRPGMLVEDCSPAVLADVSPRPAQTQTADELDVGTQDSESGPALIVCGKDRSEMLCQLGLPTDGSDHNAPIWTDVPRRLQSGTREIAPEDFYALAYTSLQIQIMTRRLRYSSNLDEIQLRKHATASANAFVAGDADAAIDALHNAFDLISEERDHYFASDPSLIDLTLVTPSVLPRLSADQFRFPQPVAETEEASDDDVLGVNSDTPRVIDTVGNVLLDQATCQALVSAPESQRQWLVSAIASQSIGVAGGGPSDVVMDELTFGDAVDAILRGRNAAIEALGAAPTVYARFSGSTPSDITPMLAGLGYRGVIPLDFVRGTGYGGEAKVILQAGAVELEALTAKPIDANADASFLGLCARLGESIDSGEIATGLFAHWPGEGCDSFHDLRRSASWSLALGRFWRIDDYFIDGEHPYHHGDASALSNDAVDALADRLLDTSLSDLATKNRQQVTDRARDLSVSLANLAVAQTGVTDVAESLGFVASDSQNRNSANGAAWLMNPYSPAQRQNVTTASPPPPKIKHVYGFNPAGDNTIVSTVDVPGLGFAVVSGSDDAKPSSGGFFQRLFNKGGIANGHTLSNQFLESTIQEKSGGIGSVFSGPLRGNRFSMRLIQVADGQTVKTCEMVADDIRVIESGEHTGVIESRGRLVRETPNGQSKVLGEFKLTYRLDRGSRMIHVEGRMEGLAACHGNPWKNYYAIRTATALDSTIDRVIVRDKLHRSNKRRMVAPLGVLVDEAERTTLIASGGFAYHRRVENRFLDTLIATGDDKDVVIKMGFSFDGKSHVANARSMICPVQPVSVTSAGGAIPECSQQWLVHRRPSTVDIDDLEVFGRHDGRMAAKLRVIQTTSDAASITLRFCRTLENAYRIDDPNLDLATVTNDSLPQPLELSDDRLKFSLSGHGVAVLLLIFEDDLRKSS